MDEKDTIVAINLPKIKKYIKKYPVTGMVEREKFFQFNLLTLLIKIDSNSDIREFF